MKQGVEGGGEEKRLGSGKVELGGEVELAAAVWREKRGCRRQTNSAGPPGPKNQRRATSGPFRGEIKGEKKENDAKKNIGEKVKGQNIKIEIKMEMEDQKKGSTNLTEPQPQFEHDDVSRVQIAEELSTEESKVGSARLQLRLVQGSTGRLGRCEYGSLTA